jgi:ADP-ribose pyrophosphatase YjhB (NUDIX family)
MGLKPHHRLLQRCVLAYARLTRGMTLGVRAMLIHGDRVLLVRHSYVPGWYLPGGGVERGESLVEALAREIAEEAGAVLNTPAQLFGVYRNARADKRDHVALFVSRDWKEVSAPRPRSREIVAVDLFPLADLPAETTIATRARVREVLFGELPSADW